MIAVSKTTINRVFSSLRLKSSTYKLLKWGIVVEAWPDQQNLCGIRLAYMELPRKRIILTVGLQDSFVQKCIGTLWQCQLKDEFGIQMCDWLDLNTVLSNCLLITFSF